MEYLLIYLLIFIPLAVALLTFILPGRVPRIILTAIFGMAMLAVVFFLGRRTILWGGIDINGDQIPIAADWIVKLVNLGLCIVFFIIGVNVRKISIAVLSLIQLILLTLLETDIFGVMKTGGLVFSVDIKDIVLISLLVVSAIFISFSFARLKGKLFEKKSPAYIVRYPLVLIMIASVCGIILLENLIWTLCFWEILTLCIFIMTMTDEARDEKKHAISVLRINLAGGMIFIFAIILIFESIDSVSISNIADSLVKMTTGSQLITLAAGLLSLAAFIRTGMFPYVYHDVKANNMQYKLANISVIIIPGFAAVYLLSRISVYLTQPIQARTIAAAGAILFVGFSFMALISGYINRSGYYSIMSSLSVIFCVIILRKEFFEWTAIILLAYSVFLSLIFYVSQRDSKKKKSQLLSSLKAIIYISIAVFTNIFIAKSFALSPLFYLLVIPACAMNTIYITNSVAFLLNNNVTKAEENNESITRYINFDVFSRIDEKISSNIINIAVFALFAIMIGVIL